MSKRDFFYNRLSGSDGIDWPENEAERAAAVRDMFGARIVGAMDVIIAENLAVLDGRLTETAQRSIPGNTIRDEADFFIHAFSNLEADERDAVKSLVRKSCSSFLYWLLVKLDQFPGARLDIIANLQRGDEEIGTCLINDDDLYPRYLEWIERFSDEIHEP